MLTVSRILESFDWSDIGPSYEDESIMVYSGDLWALAEKYSGKRLDGQTIDRIQSIMESRGIELSFHDETVTDEQGRVHNTSPNGWGWIPTYVVGDGWILAQDEAESDPEEYAELLTDSDTMADQWGVDFSSLGFRKYESQYESGLHPGQTDTPDKARQSIESELGPVEIIWAIDGTGQFDMKFSAWIRKVDA